MPRALTQTLDRVSAACDTRRMLVYNARQSNIDWMAIIGVDSRWIERKCCFISSSTDSSAFNHLGNRDHLLILDAAPSDTSKRYGGVHSSAAADWKWSVANDNRPNLYRPIELVGFKYMAKYVIIWTIWDCSMCNHRSITCAVRLYVEGSREKNC
jgi:hypothetical protein